MPEKRTRTERLLRVFAVLTLAAFAIGASYPLGTKLGGRVGRGFLIECYDANIDGSPELLSGNTGVAYAQISAAGTVEIYSSSTNDATQTIWVSGINDATGEIDEEGMLLSDEGEAIRTTSIVWRYINQMWSDKECEGTVWARRAADNVGIAEIVIGSLRSDIAQHFNGQKVTYIQKWWATNWLGTDEVLLELRWYPDDADCLDAGDGFMVLDRIHLIAGADSPAPHSFTDFPGGGLRCPAGGWIAVYGTGATADEGASVNILGFDTSR